MLRFARHRLLLHAVQRVRCATSAAAVTEAAAETAPSFTDAVLPDKVPCPHGPAVLLRHFAAGIKAAPVGEAAAALAEYAAAAGPSLGGAGPGSSGIPDRAALAPFHAALERAVTRGGLLGGTDEAALDTAVELHASMERVRPLEPGSYGRLLRLTMRARSSAKAPVFAQVLLDEYEARVGAPVSDAMKGWVAATAARAGWGPLASSLLRSLPAQARDETEHGLVAQVLLLRSKPELEAFVRRVTESRAALAALAKPGPAAVFVDVAHTVAGSPAKVQSLVARAAGGAETPGGAAVLGMVRGIPDAAPVAAANVLVRRLARDGHTQAALSVVSRWAKAQDVLSQGAMAAVLDAVGSSAALESVWHNPSPVAKTVRESTKFRIGVTRVLARLGEYSQANLVLEQILNSTGDTTGQRAKALRTRVVNGMVQAAAVSGHNAHAEMYLSLLGGDERNERTAIAVINGISSMAHIPRLSSLLPIVGHGAFVPGARTQDALLRMTERIRESFTRTAGKTGPGRAMPNSSLELLGAHNVLDARVGDPNGGDGTVRVRDLVKTHPHLFAEAVVGLYVDALAAAAQQPALRLRRATSAGQ